MDELTNKKYINFTYISRYTGVPFYYDSKNTRELCGIGQNMSSDTTWFAHKVTQEDTLDSLALKYYGNPTYWWVIAYFNNITDSFIKLSSKYKLIKVPSITEIKFEDLRN